MSLDAQRGARLRDERKRLGLSQEAIAKAVGIRREQWVKYEGGAEPGASVLTQAATAGIDIPCVLGIERSSTHGELALQASSFMAAVGDTGCFPVQVGDAQRDYCVVPRYDVRASAGLGIGRVEGEEPVGAFAFEASWMRATLGRSGRGFSCVQVHGDSMQPTLINGDEIVIDMQITRVDVSGIYVIALRGDLLVKRVQRKLDGSLIVKSDNPAYEPEHITAALADDFRVVGRLVWPRVR